MNNDRVYFDFSDDEQLNHVGIVTSRPRRGWRHRYGKTKTIEANLKRQKTSVKTYFLRKIRKNAS